MADALSDLKTRILSRVTLAALVGETVRLETRSGRPMGLCPFHAEKSPSFVLYDDHYYCFGCKQSGDAIDFVRGIQGLGFIDALRYLAGKYGVDIPELEAALGRRGERRQEASLYQMMADAQEFYAKLRAGPGGKQVDDYLLSRGFSAENLLNFGFGMTPPEGFGLVKHLRSKGYKEDDMVACSLATVSARDGRAFDFLRARLTLPIRDQHGRVIAFGGRTLDNNPAKYLNSRESKLFDKSHTLFGLDQARAAMRGRGRAVVVEGYMDTLQLWQAGMPEAVACLGTAFTTAQLKLLKPATSQVVLLFDGDTAGQRATLAAVKVALSVPDLTVKAAVLTGGEDPDSFVRKHGLEALEEVLRSSSELLDFAVRQRLKESSAMAIPEVVQREFVPWLAQVPERLTRSFLLTRIAHLTGIDASALSSQLRDASAALASVDHPPSRPSRAAATPPPQALPALDRAAFDLFGHLFYAQGGELDLATVAQAARRELELHPEHAALLEELFASLEQGQQPAARPFQDWVTALSPGIQELLQQLRAAGPGFTCANRRDRVAQVFFHVRERRTKATVTRLKAEMSRAASDPDRRSEVLEILRTIQDLTKIKAADPPTKSAG